MHTLSSRKKASLTVKMLIALSLAFALAAGGIPTSVFAEIASEDALYDSTWNYLFEDSIVNGGVIQSICATPDYLITIENTSQDPSQPDTVSAYYKNPVDANGNPVQQYSLAMRNSDSDWEHGNGMTYNSKTNEIYVALYSNDSGDNEGTIYVMDPDTLTFKRKIKIAEGYNILGIDYDSENDQYYILTNALADYSLQRRDADFNLIEDFGPIDPAPGTNFQDICVSGDYIFLSPLTYGMGIGDFMNIYSISRRETILSVNMDMGISGSSVEAEGVCMAHKGVFVCPVTVVQDDGSHRVYFYETTLPWFYTIETSARGMTYDGEYTVYTVDDGGDEISLLDMNGNTAQDGDGSFYVTRSEDGSFQVKSTDGTGPLKAPAIGGSISAGSRQALSGTSYTVTFKPDDGYKVAAAYLDVTPLDIKEGETSYTIDNIDGNHRITVDFIPTEKPAPSPAVSVSGATQNGQPNGQSLSDGTAAGSGSSENSGSGTLSDDSANTDTLHGTNISSGEQALGPQSENERRTQTRNRAFVFTIVILILLVLLLALLFVYSIHVRRVRERILQQHKEERRQRRLAEEAAERKRRRRKKKKSASGLAQNDATLSSTKRRKKRKKSQTV